MKNAITAIVLGAGLVLLGGCSGCKKGCMDIAASNYDPDATKNCCCEYLKPVLKIDFRPMLNGVPFEYNKTTVTDIGIPYDITVARFFVSNIVLHSSAGDFKFTDDSCTDNHFLLVSPDQLTYELGVFNPGTYTGISFTVGVDTVINNTMYPAEPCIAGSSGHVLQTTNMHWSWAFDYIHLKIEGNVDTNSTPDAVLDDAMFVHTGTNALVRTAHVDYAFTAANGTTTTLKIDVDYSELLNGIDLLVDHQSQTLGSAEDIALATAIMDNAPDMFSKQ